MRVSLRRRSLNSLALQRYKLRKRSKPKWWCMMKWCPRYFPSSKILGERTLFGEKIWDGWTQLLAKFNYRKLKYPSFQKIVSLEKWKVSERFAKLAVVSLRWNNEPHRPQIYGNIVFLNSSSYLSLNLKSNAGSDWSINYHLDLTQVNKMDLR